ncbi:Wadjet anti-phage system protein JetA family protein [Povalibacter sp.]|uniref:Wadjet anti-phage system protein JetA family protein n=1 Tax=Povalibacter sp. TaxID=1962978 RepID=UPI002F40581F
MEAFFTAERLHFFRPLTGKYREQVMACLRALYARLYSSLADYSRVIHRDLVLEVFQEAITQAPVLDASEDDTALPTRTEREQANWMLNLLLEYGWVERQVDEVTLTSTYAFSRIGRLFAQPMHELEAGRFRTRHRNTRNTCNALRSFLEKHEAHDLLDAYEYSERIVADFSDVIAELEERKRQLIRDVEAQQLVQHASAEFFEFMEKRFMPDLAVRFSEDSVVKYRDELDGLLRRARAQRKETKRAVELELRRVAPELIESERRSVYVMLLEQIEARLHSAADVMLPALRNALHGFTRRADILLRQLSFSEGTQHDLLDAFDALSKLDPGQQDQRFSAAADHLAVLEAGFVDPDHLKLYNVDRRRTVDTRVEIVVEDDPQVRRRLFVEQALERAFAINNRQMYDYLVGALAGGHEIRTATLPMRDARELLYAAHIIELGSASWSGLGYRFEVADTGNRLRNDYYDSFDEFVIRVIEQPSNALQVAAQ